MFKCTFQHFRWYEDFRKRPGTFRCMHSPGSSWIDIDLALLDPDCKMGRDTYPIAMKLANLNTFTDLDSNYLRNVFFEVNKKIRIPH
jgi:hypothetical protein